MTKALRILFNVPFFLFSFLFTLLVAFYYRNQSDFNSVFKAASNDFCNNYIWLRPHISCITWILLLTYLIY